MADTQRMAAAYIDGRGPADAIRYGELPVPPHGADEVLVQVDAVAVNHVDTFVRSGAFATDIGFPFVVGRDVVGRVVDAGSEVAGFAPGDRVWSNSLGHAGRQGPSADLVAVPGERLYHLPPEASPLSAVAVLHPSATAYLAWHVHGSLRAGETVYVAGGAGPVGSALLTLASAAGARVLCSARPADHEYCRAVGADGVVDYRSATLWEELTVLSPRGVDIAIDTSGRQDVGHLVELLAGRGRLLVLAGMSRRADLTLGDLYTRDRSIRGFAISNATVEELTQAAAAINDLLVTGALRPRRTEAMPLAEAGRAHARLERGDLRGARLILLPEGRAE